MTLDTDAQGIDNRAESVEQDLIFRGLFLERIDDAIDQADLKLLVDIRHAQRQDDLRDHLYHHLAVRLCLVLEFVDYATDG